MKKTKLIGVSAAALLLIAPVATPAVTTTAQAATTDSNVQATSSNPFQSILDGLKKIAEEFQKQIKDNNGTPETSQTTEGQKAAVALNAIKDPVYDNNKAGSELPSDNLKALIDSNNQELTTTQLVKLLKGENILTDKDAINTIKGAKNLKAKIAGYDNTSDFEKIVNSMTANGNGEHFTVNLTVKDGDTKGSDSNGAVIVNRSITFTNNTKVVAKAADLNVQFTSPVSLAVNSATLPEKLSTSVDATVTDSNGTNVAYTANPGDFYKTETDARNQNSNTAGLGTTFNVDGSTYYQPVTLTFDKNAVNVKDIYDKMQHDNSASIKFNNKNANEVDINTTENSIHYVRVIQVGAGFVTPDNPDDNNNNNNTDNGTWSETAQPGVVTVNGSIAGLSDDNNSQTSRSLAAGSAWQTDKYRVNSKTGVKQYHVSTHEWVNASDVSFSVKDTSAGLNNITNLSGYHSVSLAGPAGFIYTLFTTDGGRSNRGLSGLTSWYTDKSATDAAGNTYYRVSTDEWVQASTGVSFN